ncbi:MAG: YpdA family putative bacillithiol disulfide reductase [Acidobacteriota bacterium]|nr:YpdA family putative bacillithiol disulfide reductase [Acidobacteriota bacterium]
MIPKLSPMHDIIIIGAGPTGLACAIEAETRGLDYLVIEKGCIVNSIKNFPLQMTFFTTPELLEIGGMPFVTPYQKPTRLEALKYYRRVADTYRLKLHLYETVLSVEGRDGNFQIKTETRDRQGRHYRARKIVLATGYYDIPNFLNVPGEDLPKVTHYYREAHPYYGMDVAVIGGKNSAAVAALDLYRAGARVTLIHRGSRLSSSIKYWIKPDIENRIKAGEIQARFDTTVVEITQRTLVLRHRSEENVALENDFVFAMTGYRPDLEFFHTIGVRLDPEDQRPLIDKESYESNVAGVYLAGVVVAGMFTNEVFIENGRFHGKVVVDHITERLKKRAVS